MVKISTRRIDGSVHKTCRNHARSKKGWCHLRLVRFGLAGSPGWTTEDMKFGHHTLFSISTGSTEQQPAWWLLLWLVRPWHRYRHLPTPWNQTIAIVGPAKRLRTMIERRGGWKNYCCDCIPCLPVAWIDVGGIESRRPPAPPPHRGVPIATGRDDTLRHWS